MHSWFSLSRSCPTKNDAIAKCIIIHVKCLISIEDRISVTDLYAYVGKHRHFCLKPCQIIVLLLA